MTDTKLTISIGIPAYNEEANIRNLIDSILSQVVSLGELKEIIIVSDGSTDKTVMLASYFSDGRIVVVENKERAGKMVRQNQIFNRAVGDVLIMFDADVIPVGTAFIDTLVAPFLANPNLGLLAADTISAKPNSFFESVIAQSHLFKTELYRKINNGDTIYLCHGRCRLFSRALYKELVWPNKYSEDAFSYLYCKQKGFGFAYVDDAKVVFRSPGNLNDHLRQSQRFVSGLSNYQEYFEKNVVTSAYQIPKGVFIKTFLKFLMRHPIEMTYYCLLMIYIHSIAKKGQFEPALWEISESSKKVV